MDLGRGRATLAAEAAAAPELAGVAEEGDSSRGPVVDEDEAAAGSASRLAVSDRVI